MKNPLLVPTEHKLSEQNKIMQIANGRLKLNRQGSDIPLENITPAQARILHEAHVVNTGGTTITSLVLNGDIERSNRDEVIRLREKYGLLTNARGQRYVDTLFPGDNPVLPQTFKEAGFETAAEQGQKLVDEAKVAGLGGVNQQQTPIDSRHNSVVKIGDEQTPINVLNPQGVTNPQTDPRHLGQDTPVLKPFSTSGQQGVLNPVVSPEPNLQGRTAPQVIDPRSLANPIADQRGVLNPQGVVNPQVNPQVQRQATTQVVTPANPNVNPAPKVVQNPTPTPTPTRSK